MLNHQNSVLAIHMGEDFSRLSPLLQYVHLGNKKLVGKCKVSRGNLIARIMCEAFHFPKAGDNVDLRVECCHTKESMTWKRNFNGLVMESHFNRSGEYLVEHLAPLALRFKALEQNGQLQYQFAKTRFLGIPIPNFLSPQITAGEKEINGHYHFSVKVTMFLIGMVISYGGDLTVEPI